MALEFVNTDHFTNPDCVAYYQFSKSTPTSDSKGSHTLTAISDPAEDTAGQFDSAIALDGNDAYSAVDHADFRPSGVFTIGAWFKTSTTGATQMLIQNNSYDGTIISGWRLNIHSTNKLQFHSARNIGKNGTTDNRWVLGTTTVTDGNWHFAVAVYDGSYLRIYLDGNSDATAIAWAYNCEYATTTYPRVGTGNNSGANLSFFTGSLDDVFLINGTALTAAEISTIYTTAAVTKYVGREEIPVFDSVKRIVPVLYDMEYTQQHVSGTWSFNETGITFNEAGLTLGGLYGNDSKPPVWR